MMRFLISDVELHLLHLRLADTEGRIAGLPGKSAPVRPTPLHPTGRMRFDLLNSCGDGESPRLYEQHVNVISRTVYEQRLASQFIDRTTQIGKVFVPDFWGEP